MALCLAKPFRLSLLAFSACAMQILSGCSVDNYGAVVAKVTAAEGSYVIDAFTMGASLRTRADDPGLSLGFDRRSYVYAAEPGDAPEPGWYYFAVPLPASAALVLHSENYGVELRGRTNDAGLTIGYRATTVMAQVPAGESTFRLISYAPGSPEHTRVLACGDWPCQ